MQACRITKWIPFILSMALVMGGCYYDVEEVLYAGGCPERLATYEASVAQIIESNCSVCHSGANPDGGLMLTNYTEVRQAALNGALLERISLPGSNPSSMPPNGPLNACKIQYIQNWIDAGAPEN